VDFSEAMDLFVNIFQIHGPKCKMSEIRISRNYFPKGNPWTESTSPWTTSGAGPRWTTVTVPGKAHWTSAGMASPCVEPHRG
jgi:hypothetical protein